LDLLPSSPAEVGLASSRHEDALNARNDIEAVTTWLIARGCRSQNTFAAYRRAAVLLLTWLDERGLTLADMKVEHANDFLRHLGNPPAHWLRPRNVKQDDLLPTQLLTKALDGKSINYIRTVLGQMTTYLHAAGYLTRNIMHLTMRLPAVERSMAERHLDQRSWAWLESWVSRLPRSTDHEAAQAARARWVMALLYHTGIRREEAAIGRMGDFVRDDKTWRLRVVGKGKVERYVTVNTRLIEELMLYRSAMDMSPPLPSPNEATPLVVPFRGDRTRTMSPRAIGKIVAEISNLAAANCPDEHIKARLEAMSTHWMRHTNATHRLAFGASMKTTQDELGHKDPRTTGIYAKVADGQRIADAEKLARGEEKEY